MNNITVIIVTYNRPLTLLSVIDSYLNQSHIREVVIIDDGSDKSYEKFNEYCSRKCHEKQIDYIYKKNSINEGAANARRVGVFLAKCDYVLWGEDDLYLGDKYTEALLPYVNHNTAALGAIYYDMEQSFSDEEKHLIISKQQNADMPLINWSTLEGYFRFPIDEPEPCIFGHAIYMAPRKAYESIEIYGGYKVNGFREETDIQLQLRKKNIDFLYCGFAECYHLKERIGDEKYGGQHKNPRIVQEVYYIINNNRFIDRNYETIKAYKNDICSARRLKYEFFKERVAFLFSLAKRKIGRVVHV